MSYQYHIKPKEHAYHACSVALSDKGWTSNYITKQWFLKCFIHQAKARNTSGKPMLLIFNGHHLHETIQLHDAALEDNIHLYCIPPIPHITSSPLMLASLVCYNRRGKNKACSFWKRGVKVLPVKM